MVYYPFTVTYPLSFIRVPLPLCFSFVFGMRF